jgi:two-component system sensor histidine kinase MprB
VSFRLRLTVLAALAVAVAIVGTSVVVYFTDRHELIGQVDSDLSSTLTLSPFRPFVGPETVRLGVGAHGRARRLIPTVKPPPLPGVYQLVLPRSSTSVRAAVVPRKNGPLQVRESSRFTTRTVNRVPTRVLTVELSTATITVSRSLVDVDRALSHLRWVLVLVSLGGVGAAALLGAFVAGRGVAPLRRLTETTERIVETGDLSRRIGRSGRDEISRLSIRLDELFASLDASLRTQRQLVADASHELRTPLATMRANVGLLANPDSLESSEREELIADVQAELEEMTLLVAELVELARGEELDAIPREFRLDELVQSTVERAARRAPGVSFRTSLEPSLVTGVPERVERAVSNLLDNAGKWSPPDQMVDVTVHDDLIEVRDRGPGIAAEDVPLVFNRFYRAGSARGMPGAGLGLSIVKQVAEAHGGSVAVDRAPDGGAIISLRLSSTR